MSSASRSACLCLLLVLACSALTSSSEASPEQASAKEPMSRKSLPELLDTKDPAWPLVLDWVRAAKNQVEVLAPYQKARGRVLTELQVTTHSTLGAVAYETGGIIVDKGWLRILGSGSSKLSRTISDWNLGKTYSRSGEQPKYLLIADDVVGGFFAINGGGLDQTAATCTILLPTP